MNEFGAHLHSPGRDARHRLDAAAQPVGCFQQNNVGEGLGQSTGCGQARHATPNNGDTDCSVVGWHSEGGRGEEGRGGPVSRRPLPMRVRRLEALSATLAVGQTVCVSERLDRYQKSKDRCLQRCETIKICALSLSFVTRPT